MKKSAAEIASQWALRNVFHGVRLLRSGAVVLPCDEQAVPAQDRVRRDDTGNLLERLPADRLALDRQSSALGVSQPKTTSAELLSQDAVLLAEVVDDV